MVNNPNFYSQTAKADTSGISAIGDGSDFPHTGLIKALSDGLGQNYAISGFNVTATSKTAGSVSSGVIFRDGKKVDISTGAPYSITLSTTYTNGYHLLVVDSSDTVVVRNPVAEDKVPAPTAGDTVIGVLTHTDVNPFSVQFLTINKTEHSLSVGRDSSGYTESLTIESNSGDVTIKATEQDKDIIFNVNDGGTDTEVMRIDGATGNVGIGTNAPTEMLHLSDADATEPTILIENTGTSTQEPELIFFRTGTAAEGQDIGHIRFKAKNSNSENINYFTLFADAADETDGTEDGRMIMYTMRNGILTESFRTEGVRVSVNAGANDVDFRVSGDNETNLIYSDALNDKVGIGTNTPDARFHVESSSTGDIFVLECTDNGTDSGPDISMIRDSSSPASGDFLGRLVFKGRDAGGNLHEYGNIKAQLGDPTNGAEDFNMFFQGLVGGNNKSFLGLRAYGGGGVNAQAEVCVNENSEDIDFRVEGDTNTHALFVRASDNRVGINNSSPTVALDVTGSIRVSSEVEINGDLNHDGTEIGFFGTAPATQTTVANLAATTITARPAATPTGANSFDPVMDVYIGQLESEINSLRTKVDALLDALQSYGLV